MDRALRDRIIDHVIGLEGGYVDDPLDSGGRTRWGITEAVARRAGYEGPMAELPVSVARGIYISEYWDALNLDAIGASCPALAAEAFEAGVNCGVTRAGRWLQRALNALNDGGRRWADVAVDGSIGPASLSALAGAARQRWRAPDVDATLAALLNILQGGHYVDLAERREKDERFLRGWLVNRVMAPAFPGTDMPTLSLRLPAGAAWTDAGAELSLVSGTQYLAEALDAPVELVETATDEPPAAAARGHLVWPGSDARTSDARLHTAGAAVWLWVRAARGAAYLVLTEAS